MAKRAKSLCGLLNSAFKANCQQKKKAKPYAIGLSQSVNEAEMAEPIPFRLAKYDVLPSFFHVNVKVKSALTDGNTVVPSWDGVTPYPFTDIIGGSLTDGLAAASGFERGFRQDVYRKNAGVLDANVALQQMQFADMITSSDAIFHQKTAITVRRSGGSYLNPLSDAPQNYVNVQKNLVVQQTYDLDENGNVIVNADRRGCIIGTPNRTKKRELCKLVKLTPDDVKFQCGIMGKIGCISFMDSVRSIVQNNRVDASNLGVLNNGSRNPNYGNFTPYFSKHGCVLEDGRIDVSKYVELLKSDEVGVDEFVKEFLVNCMLCSDPEHTYVWVPVTNTKRVGDCAKDIEIYNAFNKGRFGKGADESVAITEAISGLSNSVGDIVGDTWREMFFASMVSAKQQRSKRVLTFLTAGRQKKVMLMREVLNQGLTEGVTREFICIDDVASDVSELDYSEFFKSEEFKDVLNGDAPRKFNCCKISGVCVGFPFDRDIEEARIAEQKKRQKINNREFLSNYLDAYSARYSDCGGFHVALACPSGMGNGLNNYFFFRGYGTTKNPCSDDFALPSATILPSDDNSLMSVLWYNERTSKTLGKINMPTYAKASQRSASGRSIGYKSTEIPEVSGD